MRLTILFLFSLGLKVKSQGKINMILLQSIHFVILALQELTPREESALLGLINKQKQEPFVEIKNCEGVSQGKVLPDTTARPTKS